MTDKTIQIKYGDPLLRKIYYKYRNMLNEDDVDLEVNSENSTIAIQNNRAEWRQFGQLIDHHDIETLAYILAGLENKVIDTENPYIDTQIPYDGARLHIVFPAGNAKPTLSIRKHSRTLGDLDLLMKTGMFTPAQKEFLLDCIRQRKSIVLSGETGSGKTTLLNALINEIDISERLVIIEDTREIVVKPEHWNVSYTLTGPYLTGFQAVQNALRENPDRIIYGEVRNEAALALIDSWNTGHRGGMGTIHSEGAREIKDRFIRLCSQAAKTSSIDEKMVQAALDIGIQLIIDNGKRRISEIYDFKTNEYVN